MDLSVLLKEKNRDGGGDDVLVNLTWWNVGFASLFILVNVAVSLYFQLHLEKMLLVAAIRCVLQLTMMGLILENVFSTENPLIVLLMAVVLVFLGACEVVFNKTKRRFVGMFPIVILSMGFSGLAIAILGTRFAMGQQPIFQPTSFIPIVGLLLGPSITGLSLALDLSLTQLTDNMEKTEIYLAFGASRWEAGRMVVMESLRYALLPTVNQLSIIGLVAIPGMMTGQIMSGAPPIMAARYQQIIMFMVSATTSLGTLLTVFCCILTVIDPNHRLRPDRIFEPQRKSLLDPLRELASDMLEFISLLFGCFAYVLGGCGRVQRWWLRRRSGERGKGSEASIGSDSAGSGSDTGSETSSTTYTEIEVRRPERDPRSPNRDRGDDREGNAERQPLLQHQHNRN
ncbi:uncharacterized protein VTP21DRAFT_5218 [Calcarisporiella thermophila]|uniref:uncharacterized protein n=1 Tax=Calcarisporiella thermophila TaxID=911321 RepID=UPI003743C640